MYVSNRFLTVWGQISSFYEYELLFYGKGKIKNQKKKLLKHFHLDTMELLLKVLL